MRLSLFLRSDCPLVRLVLSRPQHFADAQHVFRGPHIQPVGDVETLRVAVLGEFQHLGDAHRMDVQASEDMLRVGEVLWPGQYKPH